MLLVLCNDAVFIVEVSHVELDGRLLIYSELLMEWIDRETNEANAGKNRYIDPLPAEYRVVYCYAV